MAKTRKTQHSPADDPAVDPAAIAQHFIQLWQDQWQNLARTGAPGFAEMQKQWFGGLNTGLNTGPFSFQGHAHGASDPVSTSAAAATALELATAAMAASEQCLELLKLYAERLDELSASVHALDGRHKPKAPAKPAAQKPSRKR